MADSKINTPEDAIDALISSLKDVANLENYDSFNSEDPWGLVMEIAENAIDNSKYYLRFAQSQKERMGLK